IFPEPKPAAAPVYAEVALPLPMDQAFTYAVPDSLRHRAQPGMRALVPVQNRMVTGFIVGLTDSTDIEKVKLVVDLPDDGPVFSPDLLELCQWIAEYYCCSWGEALQAALPGGLQLKQKVRYLLQPDNLTSGRFSDRQRQVIAELHRRGPLTAHQLGKAVGGGALSNTLQSLVARNILGVEATPLRDTVSVRTETYVRLVEESIPEADALAALQRRAPRQAAVYLDLLHGEPERLAAHLYEKHQIDSTILKALEDKGLILREEKEAYRIPQIDSDGRSALKHDLNGEQQAAYDAIVASLNADTFQTFLLKGITGSGKTEVYLQAIETALTLKRDAIILVPEISLTPQTVGRFKARFQTDIAVLHSALSAGERYDEWRRAQRGEVRIVVGARSAIFAPLPKLGMIVVDEEHDTSYKQADTPRYHARDVAIMRAKLANGVCVLGSATPSVESYHNSETGKSQRLELWTRATKAALPDIEIVDMRREMKEEAGSIVLSRKLEAAIEHCLGRTEQVLLLLNRRGYAPYVMCPQCGWVAYCTDCQVTMTYHAKGAYLNCHYCNSRRDLPAICDECDFNPLLFLGTGTQKLEDYLLRGFPNARIERMDADTTSGKGGHAKILGRLAANEIDVLVGTQMIAKGHDYPGVTLVGVIGADNSLCFPDFRAGEQTFQLLTQVAGRAGRSARPGRVLLQTFRPNHYAIKAATQHDYEAFYSEEIMRRREALYPPFRRMANFAIEGEDPRETERAVAALQRLTREQIAALDFKGVEILGPAPATVRRVKKKYRWNLGLMSRSGKRLNTLVRATRDAFAANAAHGKVQLKVDLDPYGVF
ncbi:MAG: primosomal protein N', partial [Candidatus Hydrogenedentes bacterium]|nr:primosomal protein N' [Candidatus Hydrogenedentota bacterium]